MLAQAEKVAVKEVVSPVLMAYTVYGEKASNKSPLILLHGLFSRRTQWDAVARKISEATKADVIAADLRNHGESPWTAEFSHRHIAADVQHLLQAVGVQKAHVLGHGFGGRTAVQLALEKPQIIKTIIVSESSPFGIPPGYWRLAATLKTIKSVPIKQNVSIEEARKGVEEKLRPKIRSPIMRKLFLSNLQVKKSGQISWHFNLDSLLKNMEAACPIPELRPGSSSPLSALFVCGEASDSLPKYHLREVMSLFPKSTVVYAGGAGYRIYQDRPIFFSEFISDFVNKH